MEYELSSEFNIEHWLSEACDFVIFRYPNDKKIFGLQTKAEQFANIDELPPNFSGFLFAPFSTHLHPIVALPYDNPHPIGTVILKDSQYSFNHNSNNADTGKGMDTVENVNDDSTCFQNYAHDFTRFLEFLQKKEAQKLVLARSQAFCCKGTPHKLFIEACEAHPNAMVYLFNSTTTGLWLGATPEILIEGNAIQMHTIALAGTMKNSSNDDRKLSRWSRKNQKEQAIVADYIRTRIQSIGTLKDEWGPYSFNAGLISHLKTDLYFTLPPQRIASLIKELHPTPAVCGFPKQKAMEIICQTEHEDRAYYAGFLGWYAPQETTKLFVNLRCMKWLSFPQKGTEGNVQLMAGGGLLSSSILEEEWNETKVKMMTLLKLPSF